MPLHLNHCHARRGTMAARVSERQGTVALSGMTHPVVVSCVRWLSRPFLAGVLSPPAWLPEGWLRLADSSSASETL